MVFKSIKLVILLVIVLAAWKVIFHGGKGHVLSATIEKNGQTVCLDPGHGGEDPGASNGSLSEATVNLQVSLMAQKILQTKGYSIYMTRTGDKTLSHADRYNFCNAKNAAIMVSVHQNSYPADSTADYSTALVWKPQDDELGSTLASVAGKELGLPVTPIETFDAGVLMKSHMPAAIIESLFITDSKEAAGLASGSRVSQEAQAIADGIDAYLKNQRSPHPQTYTGPAPTPIIRTNE